MQKLFEHLAVVACVFLLLEWAVPVPPGPSMGVLFIHHAAVTVLAFVIPTLFRLYRYRSVVAVALSAASENGGVNRRPLLRFLELQVRDLKRRMSAIQDRFVAVDEEEVKQLTRRCFEDAFDAYVGVDSGVPSEFMTRYGFYLDEHQRGNRQNRCPSARFLLVEADDLQRDLNQHSDVVRNFVDWHISHGVLLLQASPTSAEEFARGARLGTTDLALWMNSYALLFLPVRSPLPAGAVSEVQFSSRGQESYQRAVSYISNLNGLARRVHLEELTVNLIPRTESEKAVLNEGLRGIYQ